MPRIGRRWRFILSLTLSAYLLYNHFPSPPKWENSRSGSRSAPPRRQNSKASFLYQSRFRNVPDIELEQLLDRALLIIENSALPDTGGSVKKIWQTGPEDAEERHDECRLWEKHNPGWEYFYLTDDEALNFVASFKDIPFLLDIYIHYPLPVLRADLIRYLLLWYHGGYYADIDVHPVCSIDSCQSIFRSLVEDNHLISLVVGVEIDEPYASPRMKKTWHWSRTYGFIQYTLYAPKRFSPFLRRAIVHALAHSIQQNSASSGLFHGPRYKEEDILEVTGPGMFTDAVLDVLSESLPDDHPLVTASVGQYESTGGAEMAAEPVKLTWAPFHRLNRALWIDGYQSQQTTEDLDQDRATGLVVLPINVWGNGQRHSGSERFDSDSACVNHRFGRTWKKGWREYVFG